jgi:hypothetical protein
MSRIRIAQYGFAVTLWFAVAIPTVSCTDTKINGFCDVTTDCYTEDNFAGWGTACIDGLCRCPDLNEEACCPNGGYDCELSNITCRSEVVCKGTVVSSGGGPSPVLLCSSDAECPGPPDPLCGLGRCVDGACELEIRPGEAITNQVPGDCKVNVCSLTGELLVWMDPADRPLDGNPCTFDDCLGDTPIHPALPDTSPCPGEDSGICVLGQCEDCSVALGIVTCPGNLECIGTRCDPATCNDGIKADPETHQDCGGPDCAPCEESESCLEDRDCLSNVCTNNVCQKSTHIDGEKNDSETGVDCGYKTGPQYMCDDGEGCGASTDCASRVCYLGVCQVPTCTDSIQNGAETGVDCGAPEPCPPCTQ